MGTSVKVNTYSYSVTYAVDKLLNNLKNIIRLSGLSPEKLTSDWQSLEAGIRTWLRYEELTEIILEVYNPSTDELVGRWDFEIEYSYTSDGEFYTDTDLIKYHILKQGVLPSSCDYRILVDTTPDYTPVSGWKTASLRSTAGFARRSIGTTVDASGLSSGCSYWRRTS